MISFIAIYLSIGFFITFLANVLFYVSNRELSKPFEVLVILLIWPTVIVGFLNAYFDVGE
ncbi:hypothetical protein [Flagellimonas marinaquae]|uniref:hypothetical protein n=1 Tax=Flagellimonas marinaquae TaxID=254955 RepID=UPI000F8C4205|nr:hypothetical protein [Allomuricauda aquimarina]